MLNRLHLAAACLLLASCGYKLVRSDDGPGDPPSLGERPAAAVRPPQVIVDEEIAVNAGGGYQAQPFRVPANCRVQVQTEGRKDTDNGYSVYLVAEDQIPNVKSGRPFQSSPGFRGLKVRSFTHTETVPEGIWVVIVQNSENLFNTMVVRLRVVTDPS